MSSDPHYYDDLTLGDAQEECAFCDTPHGALVSVRDEGRFVETGETAFELACLACRMKYGLVPEELCGDDEPDGDRAYDLREDK